MLLGPISTREFLLILKTSVKIKAQLYISGINLFVWFSHPFRFESDDRDKKQLPVRLISDEVLSHVEFRSSPDPNANLFSRLNFKLSSMKLDCTVSTTHKSPAYRTLDRPFSTLYNTSQLSLCATLTSVSYRSFVSKSPDKNYALWTGFKAINAI